MWNPQDLEVGKKKELEAVSLIEEHYKAHGKRKVKVWLNPATDLEGMRECDLFDNFGIKWEIKYDRRHKETGNVYLEHAGIRRSGADYVLFMLDTHDPVMVAKDLLLVLIEDNLYLKPEYRKYPVVKEGESNEGIPVPLDDILKLGKILHRQKAKIVAKKKKVSKVYSFA